MGAMVSQITSLTIVYSTVYSCVDQRTHQSSASLAFVRAIHRWPVNSPHKWPVTRKMFPFDDVIIRSHSCPKSPPCPTILIISVITCYDEPSPDAIVFDGSEFSALYRNCIFHQATLLEPEDRRPVDWAWSQISFLRIFICSMCSM